MARSRFFQRWPGVTLSALVLVALALLTVAAEFVLRSSGYLPGAAFAPFVEQLEVSHTFYTDEHGLFKANATAPRPEDERINADGFRSPAFESARRDRPSILLLGDSFAWGASAEPLTESFADLLRRDGYIVHNTGVPGAGPTQYARVAEVYAPRLKPDVMIAALYLGNDLKDEPDPLLPGKNFFHVTNAGWISGFDEQGQPLTAEQAYALYIDSPKRRLQNVFYQTSVGTALWKLAYDLKTRWREFRGGKAPETPAQANATQPQTGVQSSSPAAGKPPARFAETRRALESMARTAEAVGARFLVLVIPSKGRYCRSLETDEFMDVIGAFSLIRLDDARDEMYTAAPDCHFDNSGHAYAHTVILEALRQAGM